MKRRVIVTRPQPQCQQWVQTLVARGFDAEAMPLIETAQSGRSDELARLGDAWCARPPGVRAILFVSPQAVWHAFAAGSGPLQTANRGAAPGDDGGPRCWAPGLGTAAALVAAGVPRGRIDHPPADGLQFDSEALWPVVAPQVRPGDTVWIVRGTDAARPDANGTGRDWLAQRLVASGVQVRWCVAYERRVPQWTSAQVDRALGALADGSIWLFSSSEAIENLTRILPADRIAQANGTARALVTHERIGARARAVGFGALKLSSPRLDDVCTSLESFQ